MMAVEFSYVPGVKMPVFEPFFKRRQRERGEFPEIFQTERMPRKLQLQLYEIYKEISGGSGDFSSNNMTRLILNILQRENPEKFRHYNFNLVFLEDIFVSKNSSENDEYVLSIIEMSIQFNPSVLGSYYGGYHHSRGDKPTENLDILVTEINARMKENGYGYQIEEGCLIPIDSTITHQEAVKPAILLMKNDNFQGALQEFMDAFEAYKSSNAEECIRLCGNAIESTLKQIIFERGFAPPKNQTASPMFELLSINNIVPAYLSTHYTSLFSMLKSGVPTVRNNSGGHGTGVQTRDVPDYLARFVINMTASSILFLIHAHQNTK
jgi:AbiJ N-terminal domain 4